MNSEDEELKKRFRDLADKAYSRDICLFTGFLGLLELSIFYDICSEFTYVDYELFGGAEFCERKIVRFGSLNTDYPISCIHIAPSLKKFSDSLTHRDFLGAIINLGIKRETVGDIIIKNNEAFVFCLDNIAEFIINNLNRIKHTSVKCTLSDVIPDDSYINIDKQEYNVSSMRLDSIISEFCRLSRANAQLLIHDHKVFVNGRLTENNSYKVKSDDKITVRHVGRFIIGNEIRTTKKGRLFITAYIYK